MSTSSPTASPRQDRWVGLELILISFVVLFQELTFIRWVPSQVRVVAYFPNLVLISAFLGLGIGALRSKHGSLLWLWPLSVGLLVVLARLGSQVAFTANGESEHLWLLYLDLGEDAPIVPSVRKPILAMFCLSAVTFIPLGQALASRIEAYRRRSSSLIGYALDLTGSLLGVALFAVGSYAGSTALVWFGVFLAGGVALFWRMPRGLLGYGAFALALMALVWQGDRGRTYSPYYEIRTSDHESGNDAVLTNGSLHQLARPIRQAHTNLNETNDLARQGYHLPYQLLQQRPKEVLVLGAGTGNDVATVLDYGPDHVDAVEIDPVIASMGHEIHPDRPYDSDRVTVHTTDARSYLNTTDKKYDLIVFGTLDSMTKLSALSNVRLDNFVYTADAMAEARNHLKPGGGLVLYFWVGKRHIRDHLYAMLTSVFEEVPAMEGRHYGMFNTVFMAGPAFRHLERPQDMLDRWGPEGLLPHAQFPTDDWPYLYLPERSVEPFYIFMILTILGLSLAAVLAASPEMREGVRTGRGIDLEMFLFGLAFLLLETKYVTDMTLLWGTTWVTSAVVFGSILLTLLVGTMVMEKKPLPWAVASFGLIATLGATYLVPTDMMLTREVGLRLLYSILYVGPPVFFASACFAIRFADRPSADLAFGWNLLGAVAGGLLEFFTMSLGLKAMILLALTAYLVAFLIHERSKATAASGAAIPSPDPLGASAIP